MNLSYGPLIAEVLCTISFVVETGGDKDSDHPGPCRPTIWKGLNFNRKLILINLKLNKCFKRQPL